MDDFKKGRWPPKTCEMPDLSDLNSKNALNFMLNIYFRGAGPKDKHAQMLVKSFARLLDKALYEYESARNSLLEDIKTPNEVMTPYFRTVDHLETCITTLQRTIEFARKIRKTSKAPVLPRKVNVLSDDTGNRIKKIRNAIEHMDKDIIQGKLKENDSIALVAKSDALELSGEEIYYNELANWLRELHSLAKIIINHNEN